ncbi:CBL-interacting protein kinase 18-like [Zingiber officinale]|uniref:non-specific serine/threonine protein kinase n=1 Tax=Zingiber officinale TaxID=94328 RepID=A0A8J5FYA3_ZINOF|nr:CBL-interacting protein kinase 18-like [Zingiber officinale]KAG6492687.1 hypothetical protein ZIOFF_047652 [Zingiber officinale]
MEFRGKVVMQKYDLGRLLGKGTFAKVYYARNISDGQSVAIKIIDKEKVVKAGLMEQVKREVSVMRLIRHPNIVHLFEVMASKTKIYFVMEYVKGGDLFSKVAKGKVEVGDARKYFRQLISAVDYCHSRGIYHRDLKPENLLLDENDNLKVSDFGLSTLVDSERLDRLLHTTCGTPAYVAPEVISRMGYDGANADIWSCGVILFVLMSGYYPFQDSNLMEMYKKIEKGEFKCPHWFSPSTRKLVAKILDPNPSTRISIAKIRETKWFRKGLDGRKMKIKQPIEDNSHLEAATAHDNPESNAAEEKNNSTKITNLNAFEIISLSAGFNLSGLFEENQNKQTWFTSKKSASAIISKLYEVAKMLKFKVKKKDGGIVKMESLKEGKDDLTIDFEIFEVSPSLYLVEVKGLNGDTWEYHKRLKEVRPALTDIVWRWQGHLNPF